MIMLGHQVSSDCYVSLLSRVASYAKILVANKVFLAAALHIKVVK